MNTKIEIFVAGITIVSVIVILFQQFAQPTGTTLMTIYIFDLIVVIILIADFYFRMKESKEGIKFVIKHCYEIPAMIPLFVFGLLETQSIFNIGLRGIRLIRLFRLINLFSRTSYILGQTNNRIIFTVVFSLMAVSIGAISMYMVEGNV